MTTLFWKNFMRLVVLASICLAPLSGAAQAEAAGQVLYARPEATGSGDCSSWGNACSLVSALEKATSGDEIWAAAGIYLPTTSLDRSISFHLKNGVAIYGGFRGSETERAQRDWMAHGSILRGDIGAPDDPLDNTFHVVYGQDVGASAILDGFTITGGNASGEALTLPGEEPVAAGDADFGGGIFLRNSRPVLRNLQFLENRAGFGGGLSGEGSAPSLVNVQFIRNIAAQKGGAVYSRTSQMSFTNAVFAGNQASLAGGGLYTTASATTIINAVLVGNQSATGGAAYNEQGALTSAQVTYTQNQAAMTGSVLFSWGQPSAQVNALVWDNPAGDGQMAASQTQPAPALPSLNVDPLFVRPPAMGSDGIWGTPDDDYGDLRLKAGSPALDAGSLSGVPQDEQDLDGDGNTQEPLPLDLAGAHRIARATAISEAKIDLGAYEGQAVLSGRGQAPSKVILEGSTFAYSITLTNTGAITATQAVLTVTLPVSLTLSGPVMISPSQPDVNLAKTGADLPVLARGLTIPPGQSVTLSISLRALDEVSSAGLDLFVTHAALTPAVQVTVPLNIQNAAPTVSSLAAHATASGEVVYSSVSFTDPGMLDQHTATIRWGDGTVQVYVLESGERQIWVSHRYLQAGTYQAEVVVKDTNGGQSPASAFTVWVQNIRYLPFTQRQVTTP